MVPGEDGHLPGAQRGHHNHDNNDNDNDTYNINYIDINNIYIYIYIYVININYIDINNIYIYIYIYYTHIHMYTYAARSRPGLRGRRSQLKGDTVSFYSFKSQNFKLSVSNPNSKCVAYLSVLSRISNCQSLGRKNKHDMLKTDRNKTETGSQNASGSTRLICNRVHFCCCSFVLLLLRASIYKCT